MSFSLKQLSEALQGPMRRPTGDLDRRPRGGRQAAVLILISDVAEPEIVFIERAARMRRHAGQIAFPGGGLESGDESARAAALRESREEVGLQPASVRVLGMLPTVSVPVSGYDVAPMVGVWVGDYELEVRDEQEVAAVYSIRVSELVDPRHRVTARLPTGYRGPAFEVAGLHIWGLTAHLLDWLFRLAGWEQEWDRSREVAVPERFIRD